MAKYQGLMFRVREEGEKRKIRDVLGQIRVWYANLGKQEEYYRII